MATTVTLAEYLGRRLLQCGVAHVFGVPGDFNLTLLDHMATVDGLSWVGSPNELGAGYAADAYARSRGLAAIVTTYGVGELSALNAIAGSAAEDVPVVHIAGSPSTAAVSTGRLVHHTLADGVFGRFTKAYAEVTVHQETVTAAHATDQIDAVLTAAMRHRRPAYLSIPQDLADLPVDASPLSTPLTVTPTPCGAFRVRLAELMAVATRPVLVVGHLVARFGLGDAVLAAARSANIPIVTSIAAKGVIDESEPLHRGDYAGTMVDKRTASLVAASDLVIELGTVNSDVLSGFFTHRPTDNQVVHLWTTSATIGHGSPIEIHFPDAVQALADLCANVRFTQVETIHTATADLSDTLTATAGLSEALTATAGLSEAHIATAGLSEAHTATADLSEAHTATADLSEAHTATAQSEDRFPSVSGVDEDAPLTQAALWTAVQEWLPSGTALIADTGTSFWGAMSLRLPDDTVFSGQPIWSSIGYALPAVLGQGLADPGRRPVLVIGDGAAQMTVQEFSTIAAAGIKPVVLLLNNSGYTIERALQSPDAAYNDVATWDWAGLVTALAGDKVEYHRAETAADLRHALSATGDAFTLIEVILDRYDAPPLLRALAERNSGAPDED